MSDLKKLPPTGNVARQIAEVLAAGDKFYVGIGVPTDGVHVPLIVAAAEFMMMPPPAPDGSRVVVCLLDETGVRHVAGRMLDALAMLHNGVPQA